MEIHVYALATLHAGAATGIAIHCWHGPTNYGPTNYRHSTSWNVCTSRHTWLTLPAGFVSASTQIAATSARLMLPIRDSFLASTAAAWHSTAQHSATQQRQQSTALKPQQVHKQKTPSPLLRNSAAARMCTAGAGTPLLEAWRTDCTPAATARTCLQLLCSCRPVGEPARLHNSVWYA